MNKFVLDAFNDELEILTKTAGIGSIISKVAPKLFSWGKGATEAFGAQGLKGGFNYLEKFKTPVVHTLKKGLTMTAENPNAGWLQKGVGDMVSSIRGLGAGISSTGTIGQNLKNLGRNIYTTGARQFRDARFKTVSLDATKDSGGVFSKFFKKPEIYSKDGSQFVKGRWGFSDRKILGMSADGTKGILKKRLPTQALAMSVTPVGFGAQAALFSGKNPETGKKEGGISEGLKETAKWTVARPFAEIGLGMDMLKSMKKSKINEQEF